MTWPVIRSIDYAARAMLTAQSVYLNSDFVDHVVTGSQVLTAAILKLSDFQPEKRAENLESPSTFGECLGMACNKSDYLNV